LAPLKKLLSGQNGFTLIELVSTFVIISTLAAILIPKYIDVEQSSRMQAIDLGIAELNGRETLTWALIKLSGTGYMNDQPQLWALMDTNLGADYDWTAGPTAAGGTLRLQTAASAALLRSVSRVDAPGRWRR
jgi:prepilin-type N-terminal cleavage/methylation domain-containing protein